MATLDDVLSLADLRRELRIRSTLNDALLERHRAAAIGHIEQRVDRSIVDRPSVSVRAAAPGRDDEIIIFKVLDAARFTGDAGANPAALSVRYRAAGAARGPARDSAIDAGGVALERDRVQAWPPPAGWPAMREEVGVEVVVAVGMDAGDIRIEWGQAAVLIARELYEGNALDNLPSGGVVDRLVRPYWRAYVPQ